MDSSQHRLGSSAACESTTVDPSVAFGNDEVLATLSRTSFRSSLMNTCRGMNTPDAEEAIPPFHLTRADVEAAFEFFDVGGKGTLSAKDLKVRLSAFYPQFTSKEYRFLLEDLSIGGSVGVPLVGGAAGGANSATTGPGGGNAQGTFTVDHLWGLLNPFQQLHTVQGHGGAPSNEQCDETPGAGAEVPPLFDPVREAFRVYDPNGRNCVDVQVLGHIMARIGFGELSDEELALLVRTADFDQDGKINLNDFRRLVNMKGRFKKTLP